MPCHEESSPTVDAYFAEAPAFARPICEKLRAIIRKTAPDLREVIKWGSPCYQGRGLVCGVGAFRQHVRLYFFKGGQLPNPGGILSGGEGNASGRSLKFASVDEIPVKALMQLLREAAKLDASGRVKPARRARRKELPMPDDFAAALKRAAKARVFFEALPPSCRREYIQWIITAKKDKTRTHRLNEAVTMLGARRRQNEQYRR